ncbi:hypothetical protein DFH09DRAFT_1404681 [Mycena vulgaris]|nr:hypothetical protein DFH09DRAFT_1404681 [Mycena vulgaris]
MGGSYPATPIPINVSASPYVSGTGGETCDALADFADEAAAQIRKNIESKVEVRGQDDHDSFVIGFLEKLLAWIVTWTATSIDGIGIKWFHSKLTVVNPDKKTTHVKIARNPGAMTGLARPRDPDKKGCFNCGGTDHFARDKKCPNYGKHPNPRDTTRVATQRAVESYLDFDTDWESASSESEESQSDMDPEESPDLDELISASTDEDVRVNTMREYSAMRYYSMRIVPSDEVDTNSLVSETESSITTDAPVVPPYENDEDLVPFGNYNPGPICVVCSTCALVSRQVPATPENGLPFDQIYTVCEHLAGIGLDPHRVVLPTSPTLRPFPLPESSEGASSEELFNGFPLNALYEPDFKVGIIVDITTPAPIDARSALEETHLHEQRRVVNGLRPLTALEHFANVRWLTQYRIYNYQSRIDQDLMEYGERVHEELLTHPQFGSATLAQDVLKELREARNEEQCIMMRGPETPYISEPAQTITTLFSEEELHQLGAPTDRTIPEAGTPDLDTASPSTNPTALTEEQEYDAQTTGYTWAEEQERASQAVFAWQPRAWRYPDKDGPPAYFHAARVIIRDDPDTNESNITPTPNEMQYENLAMNRSTPKRLFLTTTAACALQEAIQEHAIQLQDPYYEGSEYTEWLRAEDGRDRCGLCDSEPHLFPGEVYHERVAAAEPDADEKTAPPGFRIQVLAARVEHSSSIHKPGEIGLPDQPDCPRHLTACIAALLMINGTEAYTLIDSGSTTNSMTPEFASATKAPLLGFSVLRA